MFPTGVGITVDMATSPPTKSSLLWVFNYIYAINVFNTRDSFVSPSVLDLWVEIGLVPLYTNP